MFKINEAEEVESDEIEITSKKTSEVLVKDFLRELEDLIRYWFENGRIKIKYTLEDIERDADTMTMWLSEKDEIGDSKIDYRVKFIQIEPLGDIDKLERITLKIDALSPDLQDLLKTTQVEVKTKEINELYIRKKLRRLRKAIITKPESKADIKKFKRKQDDQLSDDMY